MIDPTPRPLPETWRRPRVEFPLPGWKGVLFGLPFVGVGALIALVLAPRVRPGNEAPREWLAAIGAVFFAGGATFIVSALRPVWRARRRVRLLALHRAEPWRADFAWDRRGIGGDAGRQARGAFVAFAGMGTFLSVFAYLAFHLDPAREGRPVWILRGVVAFFGLALIFVLGQALRLLARRLEYGPGYLHFGRFPFLLGETADVRLASPRHARRLRELGVTLRCVEERIERSKRDGDTTISVVRWQLWADDRSVPATDLAGGGLALSFDLPADPRFGTDLSATPPRYWELSVAGEAPGMDWASTFLVPVYAPAEQAR
ncbi:MAG TPA: hypothetical protein VLU43_18040 [Anaeromyxobacteraceae bacterium]|nr:hypothetical protein [Anaeromyxobacteraceae bacterium]